MERFTPVFEALNAANARYVVVGGLAVVLHGHIRATQDIDLVVSLEPEETRRALSAVERIGYHPRLPVKLSDFADPEQRERWAREKNMVVFPLFNETTRLTIDLFVQYPIDFAELWDASEVMQLRRSTIRVASLDHLLRMKRETGRPRDLQDVEELERLRDARGGDR
jgi:hypothetical protein